MLSKGGEQELLKLVGRGADVGERIATALESLNQEVNVEIDPGPPVCPHCGIEDPEVQTVEAQSTGPLSEIVIEAKCMGCENTMYAVVESYSMHRTQDTMRDDLFYMKSRRAGKNGTAHV